MPNWNLLPTYGGSLSASLAQSRRRDAPIESFNTFDIARECFDRLYPGADVTVSTFTVAVDPGGGRATQVYSGVPAEITPAGDVRLYVDKATKMALGFPGQPSADTAPCK